MRSVTAPSAAEIVKQITAPGLFVQLEFVAGTVRICSFGTTTWNGLEWTGANFTIDGLTGDGKTARIAIWDPAAAYRTLAIGGGIRSRPVTVWQAQYPALAPADPNMIFKGAGDAVHFARGRTEIDCARLNSAVMLAPRRRIAPATGFNFLAAPGTTVQWGDTTITLQTGAR